MEQIGLKVSQHQIPYPTYNFRHRPRRLSGRHRYQGKKEIIILRGHLRPSRIPVG